MKLQPKQGQKHSIGSVGSVKLSGTYLSVKRSDSCSFGGNQTWFGGMMGRCGCGIIAAADTFWYLLRDGRSCRQISYEKYERYVKRFRKYFVMIPFKGMTGWMLSLSMNFFAIRHRIPYRFSWRMIPLGLKSAIEEQLQRDIPVILCVGPGLHKLFCKYKGIKLYTPADAAADLSSASVVSVSSEAAAAEKKYVWTKSISSHFMTITGIEGNWLRISSWGDEYFIDLKELERYSLFDGFGFLTNIVKTKKIGK